MAKNSGLSCAAEKQEVVVSYLPLSHIAAQMMDVWVPMKIGAFTYFAQPDALKVRLRAARGRWMVILGTLIHGFLLFPHLMLHSGAMETVGHILLVFIFPQFRASTYGCMDCAPKNSKLRCDWY